MALLTKERTNAQYAVTLKDETGTAILKSAVTSCKLTLFNLDDDAQTIINGRNAQEMSAFTGDVTMHATSGLLTFNMQPADNAMVLGVPGALQRYERHRIIFDVTASSKRLVFQDEILVENTEKVTA